MFRALVSWQGAVQKRQRLTRRSPELYAAYGGREVAMKGKEYERTIWSWP